MYDFDYSINDQVKLCLSVVWLICISLVFCVTSFDLQTVHFNQCLLAAPSLKKYFHFIVICQHKRIDDLNTYIKSNTQYKINYVLQKTYKCVHLHIFYIAMFTDSQC